MFTGTPFGEPTSSRIKFGTAPMRPNTNGADQGGARLESFLKQMDDRHPFKHGRSLCFDQPAGTPGERRMQMTKQAWCAGMMSIAIVALAAAPWIQAQAQQASVNIGPTDLGGVVTGASGPEAGVW